MSESKGEVKQGKIAIVLVRGTISMLREVKATLTMLKLYRKNYCVIYDATPSILGMVRRVKDYVTWGMVDDDTYKLLVEKKGEKTKGKDGKEKLKGFFRLMPPRKGFGRKGIKLTFVQGGALGDRKEKINDLIQRMI